MCFGLEKFHTYIYGRHVKVQNDHKPLEMIQQMPIHAAPPWLQHMLLHMQKYDYTILNKPGKDMVLANCLSHVPYYINSLPIPIAQNVQHVQVSNAELDIIWGSVEWDPVIHWVLFHRTSCTIYHLTLRGCPKCRQQVPWIARHFWGAWDELSIKSGLLFKGTRVCIPLELLSHTLADLHGAHQGINRMQAQMREAVYWPGIDADITDYAHWCTICTKHKASPPAQPMLPRDIPNGPWQEITTDYLTHKGKEYLLVCNLFSKYPFLYKVSTKSGQSLCVCLQELISQYRLPCLIYTNNTHTLHLMSSCTSSSAITLTKLPHPHTSPGLMGSLTDKSEP